jgi:hypothetical protein
MCSYGSSQWEVSGKTTYVYKCMEMLQYSTDTQLFSYPIMTTDVDKSVSALFI